MSTITLPNIRVSSDLTVSVRLYDGGVAIDWTTVTKIRAHVYSDAQRALAGRCAVSVDGDDPTILVCTYAANKPQYLGVNRIIVSCDYMGETKTYDKPAFNFVRWTDDQEGEEIVISDPDIDVEINVEDVTSSILQNILDACIKATEEAREVVDVGRGPRGYSAYEVAVQEGYQGTEEEWLASLVGPAGESAYQLAVDQGYEGTLPEWLASLHGADGDSAYQIAVEEGFVGTKDQWLASLVGPQGLSAYQVAVVNGYQGTVSEWLASLVGPVGPTPAFSIGTVSTGAAGSQAAASITGTAAAPVLNLTIPQGIQGNTGSSVDYPYELVNNRTTDDATKGLSAAEGKRLGDDLSQLEAKVDESVNQQLVEEEGFYLVDSNYNVGLQFKDGVLTIPTKYHGKRFSFLGDSISTFGVPDQNNATGTWTYPGNRCRYPQNDLFTDVKYCWWKRLIDKLGASLGINESWAGSRVSNTQATDSGDLGPNRCISSLTRIGHLDANGTPDVIIVYAGTNDIGNEVTVGSFDTTSPKDLTEQQIAALGVTTFADAFRAMLIRLQYYYRTSRIIVCLPNFTNTYYTMSELDNYIEVIREACDYFGVEYIDLRASGITIYNRNDYLPDGIHPNADGMELLFNKVYNYLMSN